MINSFLFRNIEFVKFKSNFRFYRKEFCCASIFLFFFCLLWWWFWVPCLSPGVALSFSLTLLDRRNSCASTKPKRVREWESESEIERERVLKNKAEVRKFLYTKQIDENQFICKLVPWKTLGNGHKKRIWEKDTVMKGHFPIECPFQIFSQKHFHSLSSNKSIFSLFLINNLLKLLNFN